MRLEIRLINEKMTDRSVNVKFVRVNRVVHFHVVDRTLCSETSYGGADTIMDVGLLNE